MVKGQHGTLGWFEKGAEMAFNIGSLTYITGGGVHYWWYDRGGGDAGFQHAAAAIATPNYGPPELIADEQGKAKWNNGYTQYYVRIRNVSASWTNCWYNLEGGGAV
jgi:hypothetical protein